MNDKQEEINDKINRVNTESIILFNKVMDSQKEDNLNVDLLNNKIYELNSKLQLLKNTNNKLLSEEEKKELIKKRDKQTSTLLVMALFDLIAAFFIIAMTFKFTIMTVLGLCLEVLIAYKKYINPINKIEEINNQINEESLFIDEEKIELIERTLENVKRIIDSKRRKIEICNSLNVNNYMLDEDYSKEEDESLKLILR